MALAANHNIDLPTHLSTYLPIYLPTRWGDDLRITDIAQRFPLMASSSTNGLVGKPQYRPTPNRHRPSSLADRISKEVYEGRKIGQDSPEVGR